MNSTTMNPVGIIEMQEIIEKLREAGYGKYVDCLLDNEHDCYTKKGRLNKSATIRKLGCKGKELEDALQGMRELLMNEFGIESFLEDEESEEE